MSNQSTVAFESFITAAALNMTSAVMNPLFNLPAAVYFLQSCICLLNGFVGSVAPTNNLLIVDQPTRGVCFPTESCLPPFRHSSTLCHQHPDLHAHYRCRVLFIHNLTKKPSHTLPPASATQPAYHHFVQSTRVERNFRHLTTQSRWF